MYADVLRQIESFVDADPASGLLSRIAVGDRAAMEHFYRQFQDHVYRFALVGLADPIAAADALQAVMIQVWERARDYANGDLLVWLLGLTCREIFRRLPPPRRACEVAATDEKTQHPPFASLRLSDGAEDVQRVRAALAELHTTQRLALHLAFGEDMPHDDVADVLDCAEATAKQLILDAQRALRYRLSC